MIVLRPEPGNGETRARIEAVGGEAVALPLFEIRAMDWTPPDRDFDALLLTSANAVRHAGPALANYAGLPVVAVGAATARAAEAAGLTVAATGTGDGTEAVALLQTIGARRALLLAGREHRVAAEGPVAAIVPVYVSDALDLGADDLTKLLDATALVHSPRAGWRLAKLTQSHGIDRARIAVAAISSAAMTALGGGWRVRRVADRPTDAAVIAAALSIDRAPAPVDKTA